MRFSSSVMSYFCRHLTLSNVKVLIGGGENHRVGLFDMVLVKDNHIAVAGGVAKAIAAVAQHLKENNLDIGVEVKLHLR